MYDEVGITLLIVRNSFSLIRVVVFFKNQDRALLSSVHLAVDSGLPDYASSLVPDKSVLENENKIII